MTEIYLLISVNNISRVDEFSCLQELVENVTLVDIFQQIPLLNHSM